MLPNDIQKTSGSVENVFSLMRKGESSGDMKNGNRENHMRRKAVRKAKNRGFSFTKEGIYGTIVQ
jgi:hypothetical protein